MFTVHQVAGAIPTVELADTEAGTRAVIAPSRGGMATHLSVRGRELFYLDEATLNDPHASVRGGNPVLFPAPGKLAGDQWARDGHEAAMKQHGFARALPWRVLSTSTDGRAAVTLGLRATDETRAMYPWDFALDLTYAVRDRSLRIETRVSNEGSAPMPFGLGFHPYFAVAQADKARTRIPTRAKAAFDNVTKKEVVLAALDLTRPEVDLHLVGHGDTEGMLAAGDQAPVQVRCSEEFTRWVVWTLGGKGFVCLEPWTCPGNALNTGEGLLLLGAGEHRTLEVEIGV